MRMVWRLVHNCSWDLRSELVGVNVEIVDRKWLKGRLRTWRKSIKIQHLLVLLWDKRGWAWLKFCRVHVIILVVLTLELILPLINLWCQLLWLIIHTQNSDFTTPSGFRYVLITWHELIWTNAEFLYLILYLSNLGITILLKKGLSIDNFIHFLFAFFWTF